MLEIWKPVTIDERCSVSNLGRVRGVRGHLLSTVDNGRGYLRVNIGSQGMQYVHRLVLLAHLGPCPDGHESLHGPGGQADNSVANLRWGTHSENEADKGEHHMRKREACPRGHRLIAPNLRATTAKAGHRGCLACSRAYRTGLPFDGALADRNYEALMS